MVDVTVHWTERRSCKTGVTRVNCATFGDLQRKVAYALGGLVLDVHVTPPITNRSACPPEEINVMVYRRDYLVDEWVAALHEHLDIPDVHGAMTIGLMIAEKENLSVGVVFNDRFTHFVHMFDGEDGGQMCESWWQCGVSVKYQDQGAKTHLHRAAENNRDGIVRYLLEKMAEVNARDTVGNSPLHYAAGRTRALKGYQVVHELVRGRADVNMKGKLGRSPLHYAARGGHEQIVLYLLACKARVTSRDKSGKPPVYAAIEHGNVLVLANLITAKASMNVVDNHQRCPMHVAAEFNEPHAMSHIWCSKGDVNHQDCRGMTPLHYAACFGHPAACIQLVDIRAEVDMVDARGQSALHWAAKKGHRRAVHWLGVRGGSDKSIRDVEGRSAEELARTNGYQDIGSYIQGPHFGLERCYYDN